MKIQIAFGGCIAAALAGLAGPDHVLAQSSASSVVTNSLPSAARLFHTNVSVTVSSDVMIVRSDGIPTHPTGTFPNPTNPNRIQKQNYEFKIPLVPKIADKSTPLPFGPIGVALNGIPFYNPYNAQGRDAVLGPYAEVFDSCCGHPDPMGRYHYHKYPVCVKSPFKDDPGKHSPLIGYADRIFVIMITAHWIGMAA